MAHRAGYRCSKPDCGRPTRGAASEGDGTIDVGFAAHITAAAPGGPRYDSSLTPQERKHHSNGIWLCGTDAKLVDSDDAHFTVEELRRWKRLAERRSFFEVVTSNPSPLGAVLADDEDAQTTLDLLLKYAKSDLSAFHQSLGWPSHPIALNLRMLDGESSKVFAVSGLASGIDLYDQLAIIAAPGTGKTTTLLQLAEATLANNASVPAFISLSEWATGSDTFFQSLLRRVAFKNAREHQFDLLAQHGKLVLILDGWNELDKASRRRVGNELKRLRRDFPDLRVVISSRHKDFDIPIDGPVVEVDLLTEGQQLELAKSLRGMDGENLMDHVWRTPGLRELVAIPLYLTALLKQAPGGALPTTREEVLRLFVEELEHDRDKLATLREALQGFHREFLEKIAVEATESETVALSDARARAAVNTVQESLKTENQICEFLQPMNVLNALVDAHMLVRPIIEGAGVSFQHQQFQEWFASFRVQQLMVSASAGDDDANTTLRENILNIPVWEEAVLFACDRLSRASEDGAKAVAHAVLDTLGIDPLLSAEMIWRSSNAVWDHIREDVVYFVRKWHTAGRVDRAVIFMIDTGRAEFSEFVWPLVSDTDTQVHLHALRSGRRFRPGILGIDAEQRIAALPEVVRENVISEIASHGDMDGIELATALAKADPCPKVKYSTIESLVFRRADRFAKQILEASTDEVWHSLARKWRPHDFADPDVSARIQAEAEKIFVEETDPVRILITILDTNIHDPEAVQKVRKLVERIMFSDKDRDSQWVIHRAYELYPVQVVAGLMAQLEQGKPVPFDADVMLRMSDVVTDDGSLADRVVKHSGNTRETGIAASVVGPKTIGNLIDQRFAVYASIKANTVRDKKALSDEYYNLRALISATKVEPFAQAILERADTEDPDKINVLADLISSHGPSAERDRLRLIPETCERISAAVKQWAETLLASQEATRAQFAEIAQASERLGSSELVPVLLQLLSEDLGRRKRAQKDLLEAREQGLRIDTDAHMSWTLQYRRAFAAICDQKTIDAMRAYLRNPEFGFDAAVVLRSFWQETQPLQDESGFLRSWPDFSVVPKAYGERQSGASEDTHPFVDDIIAAINDLTNTGAPESDQLFALELGKVAFTMPYADRQDAIDTLLQLPVPAIKKQEFLTVLVLSGEALSAEIVLQGINDLLEQAKTKRWMLQDQEGWRLVHWLRLLPFTNKSSAILDVLERAEGFQTEPWHLRPALIALGYAPSVEAETVLEELAKRDGRFLSEHEWLAALVNRNTLSAARLLLDHICDASFAERLDRSDHSDLCRQLSTLMVSNVKFRHDVYERFSELEVGPAKSVLEHAIAAVSDTEGVLLLTREGAERGRLFQSTSLYSALRNVLVGRTQMESSGMQKLYSVPAQDLRKQLFDMVVNGNSREIQLATDCLNAIDTMRDDYGYVDSEPRHPNISTGVSWPLLDMVAKGG